MHIYLLQTPVIAVVGNDAGWTQISREQVPMFGSNVACGLEVRHYNKGNLPLPVIIVKIKGTCIYLSPIP